MYAFRAARRGRAERAEDPFPLSSPLFSSLSGERAACRTLIAINCHAFARVPRRDAGVAPPLRGQVDGGPPAPDSIYRNYPFLVRQVISWNDGSIIAVTPPRWGTQVLDK